MKPTHYPEHNHEDETIRELLSVADRQQVDPPAELVERVQAKLHEHRIRLLQRVTEHFLQQEIPDFPDPEDAPILHEQTLELRRLNMRKRIRVLGISGAMAAAVSMLLVSSFWFAQPAEALRAAEVLARGAGAMPNPSTVHIVAKTRPYFPAIDAEWLALDFVPAEVWRQFGDKPKWRVEQVGKVVVMDGVSTIGLFRRHPEDPEDVPLADKIPRATEGAWDTYPLLNLANVQDIITDELRSALAKGWDLKLSHETTPAGESKTLVTVEAKAGLPDGDYLKNTFVDDSDMRRVYRFDAKTQRLEGMDAYLHKPGGDVLILTIEHIEYNQSIDPAVFSLKLPEKVYWSTDPQPLPDNEKYEKMTPKEAARAFFEACAKEDWDETMKFRRAPWSHGSKEYYGGLEILHIGEPFQSARDIGKDVELVRPL